MNVIILGLLLLILAWQIVLLIRTHDTKEELLKMNANFQTLDEAIAGLQTEVANESTVIDGAVTLITGIPPLIAQAVSDALSKGATSVQLQAFDTLSDGLHIKALALAAAVASAPSGNVLPGAGVPNPAPVMSETSGTSTSTGAGSST